MAKIRFNADVLEKTSLVDDDVFMVLDSEELDPTKEVKFVKKGNVIVRINHNGWMDYNDLATQSTPLAYTMGHLKITNDGLGAYTQKGSKPYNVTELFNTTTNQFDFSGLDINNELMIRVDLLVQTTSPNQEIELHFTFDVGGNSYDLSIEKMSFKSADWHPIVRAVHFYIGNAGTKNNPTELHFTSDASANIKVNGFYISTTKII